MTASRVEMSAARVELCLHKIVGEVVPAVRPTAVLLLGSFGRGEGAMAEGCSCPDMASDVEVGVVTPDLWRQPYLDRVATRAAAELRAGVSLFVVRPDRLWRFRPRNFTLGRPRLTIESYELLCASKVLHQTSSFELGPAPDPSDLSIWEGLRLVFNRCCELLAHTRLRAADACVAAAMMNWSAKTLIACGGALLIADGAYHYAMRERLERLEDRADLCARAFGNPEQAIALIRRATMWKLAPVPVDHAESAGLWFAAQKMVDEVVRLLLGQALGLTFGSYAELPGRFLAAPLVRRDYSDYLSDSRWTPLYHNVFSALKLSRRREYRLLLRMAARPWEPWHHRAYLGGLLTMIAMCPDGSVDRHLVERALYLVGAGAQDRREADDAAWEAARAASERLWRVLSR